MNENKLANALAFLSLDAISSFIDILLVPSLVNDWRRTQLRDVLADRIHNRTFQIQYQRSIYEVYHSLQSGSENEMWRLIWNWVDAIYLFGGDDRRGERVWSMILANSCSSAEGKVLELSQKLQSKLVGIQAAVAKERIRVAQILRTLRAQPLSKWDDMVLPEMYLKPDFLADKINLMASFNHLVSAWSDGDRLKVQEMCDIHEWGKQIGVGLGLRELDVPFPNSWAYQQFM